MREDRVYLDGAYRGQVNSEIQGAYDERGRYEELSDPKYTDTGGIFDIMAVPVIQHHLLSACVDGETYLENDQQLIIHTWKSAVKAENPT
jgi:hypothetical protein